MPIQEPNWCSYVMRIRGSAAAVDEMRRRLTDPTHRPHFWRTSDVRQSVFRRDGTSVAKLVGRCPGSVRCCMLDGEDTYADAFAEDGEATSLGATAAELSLDIEVWSREPRMGFAEHYLYMADGTTVEETTGYAEIPWFRDTYPTFADLDDEYGLTEMGVTEEDFADGDVAYVGGYEVVWSF